MLLFVLLGQSPASGGKRRDKSHSTSPLVLVRLCETLAASPGPAPSVSKGAGQEQHQGVKAADVAWAVQVFSKERAQKVTDHILIYLFILTLLAKLHRSQENAVSSLAQILLRHAV